MTFLIAAAGTGGHVFPGLSVGEALLELGVGRPEIVYVGGNRLESTVYPGRGFEFVEVELAGLQRSLTFRNARIPSVVLRARSQISGEIESRRIRVVLGMGGYVTVPAAMAARRRRIPLFNAEQNAQAGLANKVAARWARDTFTSFPETGGLPGGTWVGNPVRREFWDFARSGLVDEARRHYGLRPGIPTLGVFGGSLGAGILNQAISQLLGSWRHDALQVVHITGRDQLEDMLGRTAAGSVRWVRTGFEERMELFYAVSEVVVARAGGAVAELTATATPAILVPGRFGSGGHQERNADTLREAGAAEVVREESIGSLGDVVADLLFDDARRRTMSSAAAELSKPEAALTIARRMIEAAR